MASKQTTNKTKRRRAPAASHGSRIGIPHQAAVLIVLLATAMVYANSLPNQFVFDDTENIVTNPYIRSLGNIPRIIGLTGDRPLYRPVRHVSYALDYFVSGLNPVGYHVSNILYHGLAAVLVYGIITVIAEDGFIALFAALLFALHPVQTDSVTYLSGRRDVLCGLFYLLGFLAFVQYRKAYRFRYLMVALVCYVISVFSKEMGITLPAMFLLYDITRKTDDRTPLRSFAKAVPATVKQHQTFYAALFVGGGLFAAYKLIFHNPSQAAGYWGGSLYTNFLTVAKVHGHYIQLLLFPRTLNADYSFNAFPVSNSILEPATLLSVLVLPAILVLTLRLARHHRMYLFCWLWFVLTLLPVSHIFPHHELLAEHYLYIPMFGFALFVALAARDAIQWSGRKNLILALLGLVLLLLAGRTMARNRDWRDDLTLWGKTIQTAPECARAHNNLGRALTFHGEPRKAVAELRQALRIKPDYPEAYANLGVAYGSIEMTDQARASFARAIALNPHFSEAYYNLGVSYATAGDLGPAVEAFEQAVRSNPGLAGAHYNLGLAYRKLHRTDQARFHFEQALKLARDQRLEEKSRTALKEMEAQ